MDRDLRIDLIKTIAVIYVVVLHINGYTKELFSFDAFTLWGQFEYYVLEAFAYSAIHLFVLAGSYLMIEKGIKVKNLCSIWIQTSIVTIGGLLFLILLGVTSFSLKGIAQSLFPICTKAYWYVSEYSILMLFTPLLNRIIKKMSNIQLFITTIILGIYIMAFSFFLSKFSWENSSLDLFIFLYFLSACFIKIKQKRKAQKIGIGIFLFSTIALISSVYSMNYVGKSYSIFAQYKEFFFQYNSPLVIGGGGRFVFINY